MTSSTACLIGAVLPLRRAPSTVIERLGVGELHALLDRLGAEAAEDDVVRRADARAGEHRHDDLGDHRQVDPDDVAGLDPAVLQRVGEALDVAQQLGVGDVALLALLAAPVEGDAVAQAGLDVAVQAVVRGVELAVREPLVERRVGVVEDGVLEVRRTSAAPSPAWPTSPGVLRSASSCTERSVISACSTKSSGGSNAPDRGARRAPARGSRSGCPPCPLLSRLLP